MPKKLSKVNRPELMNQAAAPKSVQVAEAYGRQALEEGDSLGSYSGVMQNPCETPVQDADDL